MELVPPFKVTLKVTFTCMVVEVCLNEAGPVCLHPGLTQHLELNASWRVVVYLCQR